MHFFVCPRLKGGWDPHDPLPCTSHVAARSSKSAFASLNYLSHSLATDNASHKCPIWSSGLVTLILHMYQLEGPWNTRYCKGHRQTIPMAHPLAMVRYTSSDFPWPHFCGSRNPKYVNCDPEHFCGSRAYRSPKTMNPRPSPLNT